MYCSCKFICIYKQLYKCVNDIVLRISESLLDLSSPIFESKYSIYIIGIVVMSRYDGILRVDVGIINAKDETDHVMIFTECYCHMFLVEFCSNNIENVGRLKC